MEKRDGGGNGIGVHRPTNGLESPVSLVLKANGNGQALDEVVGVLPTATAAGAMPADFSQILPGKTT